MRERTEHEWRTITDYLIEKLAEVEREYLACRSMREVDSWTIENLTNERDELKAELKVGVE